MSENKLLDELSSDEELNVRTAANVETTEDDWQLNLNSDTEETNAALLSEIETDDEDDLSLELLLQRSRARREAAQELSTEHILDSDTREMNAALLSEIETDDEEDVSFERLLERVRARRRAAQDTDEEDVEEATKDALERPSSENLDHVADLDPLDEDNDPNSAATDLDLGSEFDFTTPTSSYNEDLDEEEQTGLKRSDKATRDEKFSEDSDSDSLPADSPTLSPYDSDFDEEEIEEEAITTENIAIDNEGLSPRSNLSPALSEDLESLEATKDDIARDDLVRPPLTAVDREYLDELWANFDFDVGDLGSQDEDNDPDSAATDLDLQWLATPALSYNEDLDEEEQISLRGRDTDFDLEEMDANKEDVIVKEDAAAEGLSPRSVSLSDDLSEFCDNLKSRFLKKLDCLEDDFVGDDLELAPLSDNENLDVGDLCSEEEDSAYSLKSPASVFDDPMPKEEGLVSEVLEVEKDHSSIRSTSLSQASSDLSDKPKIEDDDGADTDKDSLCDDSPIPSPRSPRPCLSPALSVDESNQPSSQMSWSGLSLEAAEELKETLRRDEEEMERLKAESEERLSELRRSLSAKRREEEERLKRESEKELQDLREAIQIDRIVQEEMIWKEEQRLKAETDERVEAMRQSFLSKRKEEEEKLERLKKELRTDRLRQERLIKEEEDLLKAETEEKLENLRESILEKRAKEEERLKQESERRLEELRESLEVQEELLKTQTDMQLQTLRQSLSAKLREEEQKLKEESEAKLKQLSEKQKRLEDEIEEENARLTAELQNQQEENVKELEATHKQRLEEIQAELDEEKEKLQKAKEESLSSVKQEMEEEVKAVMKAKYAERVSQYRKHMAEQFKEVCQGLEKKQENNLKRLKEDHEREMDEIKSRHLNEKEKASPGGLDVQKWKTQLKSREALLTAERRIWTEGRKV
ncbi:hypothetical protein WMY93_000385 [Mugilogobius chulae]|uniref:Uncharacterized protein n=1 Tax=Mugilogobius chulae TaxID=88201 RepID=A0AAW0Q280_9GOBI